MELAITEIKKQEICITNFDELEKEITINLKKYDGLVLTDENKIEIKDVKSKLNKLVKAIDRERIDKTKEYNEPLQKFIEQCNTLKSKVLEVSDTLDKQLKEAEEKEKQEKLEEIIKYFDEKNIEYKELIDFDKIFQEQWLNKTYTMKKVQMDIDHIFARTNQDMGMFEETFKNEQDILKQAKQFYFENIKEPMVSTLTMQKINEIKEFNNKIAEFEQKSTKNEQEIKENIQNVSNCEKVGRVFKVICSQEELIKLNNFLQENNYNVELIERF